MRERERGGEGWFDIREESKQVTMTKSTNDDDDYIAQNERTHHIKLLLFELSQRPEPLSNR